MSKNKFSGTLKVDAKGYISFTEEQWNFLCNYLHCKDFSLKYQKKIIMACINGALEVHLKEQRALRS